MRWRSPHTTLPTQLPGLQTTGNTQTPPAPQAPAVKHAVPPTLHVPVAQLLSVVHALLSSAHRPVQPLLEKQVWLVPAHVPGLHWLEVHAALCVKLPGMRRYAVNFVDRSRFPHFPYDGFSELWFDDEEALIASLNSPEGKTLLADLPNFAGDVFPIVAVEHLMLET